MHSILVIDDEAEMRVMLQETLSAAGYDVTAASDGQEAASLSRSHPPELVITDIYMPNKDGLEVIMEMRAAFPATRIIAMSGQVTQRNMLPAASVLGAVRTLPKPFLPAELLALVEEVLAA